MRNPAYLGPRMTNPKHHESARPQLSHAKPSNREYADNTGLSSIKHYSGVIRESIRMTSTHESFPFTGISVFGNSSSLQEFEKSKCGDPAFCTTKQFYAVHTERLYVTIILLR